MTTQNQSQSQGKGRDVTKHLLPRVSWDKMAEDLLSGFPGVDRAKLLKKMVEHYFFELKYGNKREERAACEFLNSLQVTAQMMMLEPTDTTQCELWVCAKCGQSQMAGEEPLECWICPICNEGEMLKRKT